MTDHTAQQFVDAMLQAAEKAAEPATPPAPEGVPVPLTKAQQEAVQAELERQNKPKPKPVQQAKPKPVPKPAPAGTNQPDALLVDILCWPRRHDSACELAFGKWLRALPMVQPDKGVNTKELSLGSWAWEVSGPGWEEVMFSCHIDTVDDLTSCMNPSSKKRLVYDPHLQVITLDSTHKIGSCLGADDGSGVWLMLKMIEAKVPGTYVFHRGEECGGITAKGNARDHAKYFEKRKMAIAFDRAGNTDVIDTQGGATCASKAFAEALASALNEGGSGFNYKPCSNGVYTDTKDYRGVISECVNLSVGYQSQHGSSEFQDWDHLETMLKRLIAIKWHELPVSRVPYIAPAYSQPSGTWKGADARGMQDDFFGVKGKERDKPKGKAGGTTGTTSTATGSTELNELRFIDVFTMVDDDPEEAKNVMLAFMRERARLLADIALLEEIIHDLK